MEVQKDNNNHHSPMQVYYGGKLLDKRGYIKSPLNHISGKLKLL
jgi:hypothetical protein